MRFEDGCGGGSRIGELMSEASVRSCGKCNGPWPMPFVPPPCPLLRFPPTLGLADRACGLSAPNCLASCRRSSNGLLDGPEGAKLASGGCKADGIGSFYTTVRMGMKEAIAVTVKADQTHAFGHASVVRTWHDSQTLRVGRKEFFDRFDPATSKRPYTRALC